MNFKSFNPKFPIFILFTILNGFSQISIAQNTENAKFATTLSAGTNGIGGDLTLLISDKLNTRIGYHALNYTANGTIEDSPDVDYNGNLAVSSTSLIIDYYPFKKIIGLSAGLFLHSLTLDASAKPIETFEVEGKVFEIDELGSLSANMNYSSNLMPYAGIIFSNPVATGFPVKIHLQLGALYSKSPQLEMTGTGMIAPTADNQVQIQKGLDEFNFLPVVNVGLSFRFGRR